METEQLEALKKGRTKDQQKVLDYFLNEGCLSKTMKDDEYSALVQSKRDEMQLKKKALSKIGIDEDKLKEIPPTCLQGYVFKNAWAKQRADGKWVSSTYQVVWIFFSANQVYLYFCQFNMDDDKKTERTDEFFYKDVTSISTTTESEEIKKKDKDQKVTEVESNKFVLTVPGDKLFVSIDGVDNSEEIIQNMKQKLREKKNG